MYSTYALVRSDLSAKIIAAHSSRLHAPLIQGSRRLIYLIVSPTILLFIDHDLADLANLVDLPDLAVFFILTDGPISIAHHLVY